MIHELVARTMKTWLVKAPRQLPLLRFLKIHLSIVPSC